MVSRLTTVVSVLFSLLFAVGVEILGYFLRPLVICELGYFGSACVVMAVLAAVFCFPRFDKVIILVGVLLTCFLASHPLTVLTLAIAFDQWVVYHWRPRIFQLLTNLTT